MARYHNNLQYREDTVEKHSITKEEVEFLLSLQKEMNTQDTVAQADPRFWVIKGTVKVWNVSDDVAEGSTLYRYGIEIANNLREAYEYIYENLIKEIEVDEVRYRIAYVPDDKHDFIFIHNGDDFVRLNNFSEVVDWLESIGYSEFSYKNYDHKKIIYPNTMFLTQKSAEEHLKQNDYHYSADAHTYAMTSWRCHETEMLWKILQSVDWQRLLNTEVV